nr:hypothetical protein GCM10020063_025090 [Dactylosporangium thailandense]
MGEASERVHPAAVSWVGELRSALATAGLDVIAIADRAIRLLPPKAAGQAMSVPESEGSRWAQVDIDDPHVRERSNADWYRLSIQSGLFDPARPQFYLAVRFDEETGGWARVELRPEWDLMGAGAAGVLGSAWCRPEFAMLALDQSVLVCGTTWQWKIGTFVVPTPRRSSTLRRAVEGLAQSLYSSDGERVEAQRWLETSPERGPAEQ